MTCDTALRMVMFRCTGLALLAFLAGPQARAAGPEFRRLGKGLEIAEFRLPLVSRAGDSTATVVRVDPALRPLVFGSAGLAGYPTNPDARQWARWGKLALVTNAAMFEAFDHRTPTGYARAGKAVLNPKWKPSYKAVLVFGPDDPKLPAAAILDFECDEVEKQASHYRVVIQGLRMVDCRRRNTWAISPKQWSAALVAIDDRGRVLFIHCRSPYPMNTLIKQLLAAALGITRAMYLEGGPEASLRVEEAGQTTERIGSFETGFNENDLNRRFWAIPNVIGVGRLEP